MIEGRVQGRELPAFFDVGEVVFDRIKVWGIGRQEEQKMRRVLEQNESRFCFVKTGVVGDDNGRLVENRKKMMLEPLVKPVGIG